MPAPEVGNACLGFWDWPAYDLENKVMNEGLKTRVQRLGFKDYGFRIRVLGSRFGQGFGFRVRAQRT